MPRCGMTMMLLLTTVLGAGMLSAQTSGAMLYANGDVKVNGQPAGYSTSVYSGDKVEATASSAGSINRSGSSVIVSPNSSIQYDPASIELLQGSARVSTNKGMSAKVGDVVVSPKDENAKFEVTRNGDKVIVVSREGALTVKDGNGTSTVQAGASTELTLSSGGPAVAAKEGSQTAEASLLPDRLSDHPFYGVVSGINTTPQTLPICDNTMLCIRPSTSKMRPCCCPPIIMCQ
jgi:ethanolamine utilization protein EutQ (cupin superfamily)